MTVSFSEIEFDTNPYDPNAPFYHMRAVKDGIQIEDSEGNVVTVPDTVLRKMVCRIGYLGTNVDLAEEIPF